MELFLYFTCILYRNWFENTRKLCVFLAKLWNFREIKFRVFYIQNSCKIVIYSNLSRLRKWKLFWDISKISDIFWKLFRIYFWKLFRIYFWKLFRIYFGYFQIQIQFLYNLYRKYIGIIVFIWKIHWNAIKIFSPETSYI